MSLEWQHFVSIDFDTTVQFRWPLFHWLADKRLPIVVVVHLYAVNRRRSPIWLNTLFTHLYAVNSHDVRIKLSTIGRRATEWAEKAQSMRCINTSLLQPQALIVRFVRHHQQDIISCFCFVTLTRTIIRPESLAPYYARFTHILL